MALLVVMSRLQGPNSSFVAGGLKGLMQHINLQSLSESNYVFQQARPALQRLQLNLALFVVQQLPKYFNQWIQRELLKSDY